MNVDIVSDKTIKSDVEAIENVLAHRYPHFLNLNFKIENPWNLVKPSFKVTYREMDIHYDNN